MIRPSAIPHRGSALGRFLSGLLAAVLIVSGFAPAPVRAEGPTDVIAADVTVDGVAVGGLTRDAATALLQTELAHYAVGEAIVTLDARAASIPFAAMGRHADITSLVDAAWSIGRTPPEDLPGGLGNLIHGTAVDPLVVADHPGIASAVAAAASTLDVAAVNGTARATATGFARTAAKAGHALPQDDVVAQLTPLLADASTASPIRLTVASVAVSPAVDDAAVSAAITAAKRMVRPVDVIRGTQTWRVAAGTVRRWIQFRRDVSGVYGPTLNETGVTRALNGIARTANVAPRNARILAAGAGSRLAGVTVRNGRNGRRLGVATTRARVVAAVIARAKAPASSASVKVQASFTTVAPAVDAAGARALAKRLRRLGPGWTTYYVVGEANGFGANITIPARTLNGMILAPGEELDFWDALGEVSYRKGYRDGGAIIGGHTDPTGALAGGICSASTTLFNAAARAGLDIRERHNHYYYISRYPRGLDATVSKNGSGGGQGMRFRNDTGKPVLVRGIAGRGWVTFQVWGVPTGRRVTFSRPEISNYQRAYDTVQYTSTLPRGVRKRIEYPVDGFTSVVVRTVRNAAGSVIHRDRFVSGYHRIIGVVLIGR